MISDNAFNWLMKSLTKNRSDSNNYVFDTETNTLFAYTIEDNILLPWFRNPFIKIDETVKKFEKELNRVSEGCNFIISLPCLSFEDKREFLNSFIAKIDSNLTREKLIENLKDFDEYSPFWFSDTVKNIDNDLYRLFERSKWQFIAQKIKEMYEPLGISEDTTVLY